MAITQVFFAFFAGVGYLGLQTIFLDKLAIFCENPRTALAVHFYLLFITILVASYIVEARPSKNPERWLRLTGLGIVISHGVAFYTLSWWTPQHMTALASGWLGGVILTPAAICSGVAFGKFLQLQLVLQQSSRSILTVLCSIAGGALIAPRVKFMVVVLGPTLSFALILLAFVAILTILPAPASEDKQPEAW